MGDGREKVAERFEGHVPHEPEILARIHELLFRLEVLDAFNHRELNADERDSRRRAHAVSDRGLEPVAVADAAEVGEEQFGHRVVAPFECGGETEPFVVLLQHGAAQHPAAEAVTFVGDQQAAVLSGRNRLVCGRRMAGGDEHVTRTGRVAPVVAEPADTDAGERRAQATVPLLHEDTRRNDDQYEALAP